MRNPRNPLSLSTLLGLFSLALCSPAMTLAQTVDTVVIGKAIQNFQTDATTVNPTGVPALGWNSYAFYVHQFGTNLNLLSPPTISGPTSAFVNSSPYYNGGVLGFNPLSQDWAIGSGPFPNNWGDSTLSALNANFANGIYSLSVGGNNFTLNVNGDLYPNTPVLNVTGGTWSGGRYLIDASQPLTITSNVFGGFGGTSYGSSIFGGVLGVSTIQSLSITPGTSNYLQFTLPAFSLQAGNTYTGMGSFRANADLNFVGGSVNIADYESLTAFTIVAVPEPETYAMLLAGLGLLGFVAHRRKQQSA